MSDNCKRYRFPVKKIKEILNKSNGKCYYCGKDLPKDTEHLDEYGVSYSSTRNWHIDHGTPLSRGGTNHIDNLFASCVRCNSIKSNMTQEEFYMVAI